MPILRKKSSKKVNAENGNDNLIGDITIDDFANSSRMHARFKKAVKNISSEVKQETTTEKNFGNKMNENYQSHLYEFNKLKKNTTGVLNQRRSRKENCFKNTIEEEGIDYPLDIWFIISEYISPEAVGKFAQICKSSYYVVTTAKFWFHLYKSYYRFVPGLPPRLQPQCMVRTHGLRACVIRTLHYTYFALNRKVDDLLYLGQNELHSLVKRQCCLMWHRERKTLWYFYFKLKELPKGANNLLRQKTKINGKKTDFLEMLEDVAVNLEEGCKVLRVICLKYSMLPPVNGLILQSVSMTLMPGFKDHQLQLGFGTSNIPNTLTNKVILNHVVNYKIIDWWHPFYPHQDAITAIKLPQSDSWDQSLL
ncbi:hypothetical protein WN48_06020 [Eufriesea mexicana]|uniref:transmembrane protein 183 isoform X2 n=1 Tax=Eufriesea mexicana TaxID=516756 RepID=UPI00083C0D7C|nr:PREDICTED: transmembrane protein 183 isoform X2 [Eufriesea mexicana]OAD54821.1 hypothetical protein WN48_06020 [Eufriesea mexicana]